MVGAERGGRGMAETNIPKKKNQGHTQRGQLGSDHSDNFTNVKRKKGSYVGVGGRNERSFHASGGHHHGGRRKSARKER